ELPTKGVEESGLPMRQEGIRQRRSDADPEVGGDGRKAAAQIVPVDVRLVDPVAEILEAADQSTRANGLAVHQYAVAVEDHGLETVYVERIGGRAHHGAPIVSWTVEFADIRPSGSARPALRGRASSR